MTPSMHSQTFKSDSALDIDATVREVVAQMPIVILFNAIRDAFSGRRSATVPLNTRTFGAR